MYDNNRYGSTNSQQIATQARSTYDNYEKIQSFEDVGYFLTTYVVSGGVVTKDTTHNNTIHATKIVVSLNDDVQARDGTMFWTRIPNATYYLDFTKGDFTWSTSHPTGTVGTDYLQVATVTTDSNGNVATITDNAAPRGKFRIKPGFEIPQLARPVFNVLDYGAKGDATTDNTTALQAAINDAASQGGIVHVPYGRYVTKTLNVVGVTNVSIIGQGELIAKDNVSVSPYGIFRIENSSNITLDGIWLTGVNNGDAGATIGTSGNVVVRNCRISNCGYAGLSLYGGSAATADPNVITGCLIKGNGVGIRPQINAEYYNIHHNRVTTNTWGFYGGFGNIRIDHNQITDNIIGLELASQESSNPDHSSISGNTINHNQAIGLRVVGTVNGEQIIDNQILSTAGPAVWSVTGKSHSLVLDNVTDLMFIGNRIDGGAGQQIYIDGYSNCRFIGNTFFGGDIDEISAGTNNAWIGNHFIGDTRLNTHADSTLIKVANIEADVLNGDAVAVVNKIRVTSFLNDWENLDDTTWEPLCYWKDAEGCISIQGVVASGTSSIITNLPTNYRPRRIVDCPCSANDTGDHAAIRIYPNGNVQQLSGGTSKLSINAKFKP